MTTSAMRKKKGSISKRLSTVKVALLLLLTSYIGISFNMWESFKLEQFAGGLYTKSSIPRIIWQTAKSHNPPLAAKKIMKTWESLNPGWTRFLLDDKDLVKFMSSNFNQTVVDAFQNLPLPVMRADFFRLAAMYYEGGIYADVDVECNVPIQTWDEGAIDRCEAVVGMENDSHICNWGFASRKGHPLFQRAMELSLSRFVDTAVDITNPHFVHGTTGPGIFTEALRDIAEQVGCVSEEAKGLYSMCRDVLKEKYRILIT